VCFLTRSFSDQQPLEALLRAKATESHVAPVVAVINPQIAGQPAVAFSRCLVGDDVRPLRQEGFDEPFRLAVGLRRVGLGADRFEAQCLTGFSPVTGAVGGAVVRAHPAAGDPVTDPLKPCQLSLLRRSLRLGIDMNHVAGALPLVTPHRGLLLRRSASARGPGF
jgi:hypothetical protein